jgi:cytoskeletal protein CcmA (bactofilin family)
MFASKNAENSAAPNGSTTIIGSSAVVDGNITSGSDVRIDGYLKGNIDSKGRVLIGANGKVDGDIIAQQADISGQVNGAIKVKELLSLRANADINGTIYAGKLSVEPTVSLNGHVHMGANVVDIKTETDASEQRTSAQQ